MEIHLQNFRCHRDKTFVFHSGLNLIDGTSGQGKSTILEAIHYVLIGKNRNICTRGEKKCSVTLRWNDLVIQRTKLPSRLTIHPLGLEDDAAQQYIYKIIGGEDFELTSYMLQKGTSQFFTLPATEKRKFIESLGTQASVEGLKEKVANELKQIKSEWVTHETSIKLLTSQLVSLSSPAKTYPELRTVSDATMVHNCLLRTELSLEKEQLRLDNEWQETSSLLSSQLSEKERFHALTTQIEFLTQQLSELDKKIEETAYDPLSLEKVQTTIQHHESYLVYKKKKEELQEKKKVYEQMVQTEEANHTASIQSLEAKRIPPPSDLSTIKATYEQADSYRKQYKRKKELSDKIGAIPVSDPQECKKEVEKRTLFISETEGRKNVHACPHCTKGLTIQQSVICKASVTPITTDDQRLLQEYKTSLASWKQKYEEAYKHSVLREQLEAERTALVIPVDEKENEEQYRTCRSKLEEYQSILQQNKVIDSQLAEKRAYVPKDKYKPLRTQFEQGLTQLASLPKGECSTDYDTCLQIRTNQSERKIKVEQYERTRRELTEQQEERKKENQTIHLSSIDYSEILEEQTRTKRFNQERLTHVRQLVRPLGEWVSYVRQYLDQKQKKRSIQFHRSRIRMLQDDLQSLELFSRRIVESEHKCMEETIELINTKVKTYLDKFFPTDPMSMSLVTEKEAKSGKVKSELAIYIEYKDSVCDLHSLSGGEYDRCALALMLAINELSSSPFLILDESISSLDMGSSENVLDVLKDSEPNKIVLLVSHQANTGMFDHMISL